MDAFAQLPLNGHGQSDVLPRFTDAAWSSVCDTIRTDVRTTCEERAGVAGSRSDRGPAQTALAEVGPGAGAGQGHRDGRRPGPDRGAGGRAGRRPAGDGGVGPGPGLDAAEPGGGAQRQAGSVDLLAGAAGAGAEDREHGGPAGRAAVPRRAGSLARLHAEELDEVRARLAEVWASRLGEE